ncbi:MAG TPA: hypothetical protein VK558_07710 [Patescibacteria group bacterium]|nr:hypothetical protein [Patescibacteria group bacterium]
MSSYRLSALRNKGWIRMGIIGAGTVFPVTAMFHAIGWFSDGDRGIEQAVTFLVAGVVFWLLLGCAAGWVMHGFVVRLKDSDDEHDEPRGSIGLGSSPSRSAPAHTAPGHAAPVHAAATDHPPRR